MSWTNRFSRKLARKRVDILSVKVNLDPSIFDLALKTLKFYYPKTGMSNEDDAFDSGFMRAFFHQEIRIRNIRNKYDKALRNMAQENYRLRLELDNKKPQHVVGE